MLFGSRARGTQKDGADYDIAIDTGSKVSFSTMLKIWGDIDDSNIPVHVDVVDIHDVDSIFLEELTKDAIRCT